MAGQQVLQAVGPSYYLNDRKSAVQRSINLWMMAIEGLGEQNAPVLESAPGLSLFYTFPGSIRGMRNADGRLFVVAGSGLYESTSTGVVSRGTLATSSGYVSMVNGENQLALVDGANLYVLDLKTNTLAASTSAGWLGSNLVEFMDGYFIFAEPSTERFYISSVDDASTLNALDFSSADTQPDDVIAIAVARHELFLMGSRSIEVWINSGASDFPFVRYQGTPIDVGIVGYRAFTGAGSAFVWVGQSIKGGPYVYQLNGYQPQRISTQSVEQQLAKVTDLSQVRCYSYQEAGAEFVAIDGPGLQTTWVYDLALQQWHERGELSNGQWSPSRIEHVSFYNGRLYAAGGTKLYTMSRNYRDLAGDPLVRERTWAHLVSPSYEPVSYRALELRCTTGDTTAGNITLEVSNDGGAVFGAPLIRSLGAPGRRVSRVRWGPLGTCPAGGSRVHRIRCSDAVPLTIQGATIV